MRVKSKILSSEEKKELAAIMSKGNTLLKECADMLGMQHREFRGKLFSGKLNTSKLTPEQLQKLEAAKPHIFAVREKCEEKIRNGFRGLVGQQAYYASKNNYDRIQAKLEFQQEGEIAVLNAIYGYTDIKIALSTYIWRCIRRQIQAAINRMNPFCPLTNEAQILICRIEEAKRNNPELTDEQALASLGLDEEERTVLIRSMTKVVSQRETRGYDPESHGNDYTGRRRGIDNDTVDIFGEKTIVRQAVKNADLDEFELACLLHSLYPHHGWQEELAKKYMNQGERCTRQNIKYVVERAKKKVLKVFKHPPQVQKQNPAIDKFFEDMSGRQEK